MPTTDLAKPDTDSQDPASGYPKTVNDYLHLFSCYWADVMETELSDPYFATWESMARPLIERLTRENEIARAELARWPGLVDAEHEAWQRTTAELTSAREELATLRAALATPEVCGLQKDGPSR